MDKWLVVYEDEQFRELTLIVKAEDAASARAAAMLERSDILCIIDTVKLQ